MTIRTGEQLCAVSLREQFVWETCFGPYTDRSQILLRKLWLSICLTCWLQSTNHHSMTSEQPFKISVLDGALFKFCPKKDTRLPDEANGAEWDYGVPLEDIRRLITRWNGRGARLAPPRTGAERASCVHAHHRGL